MTERFPPPDSDWGGLVTRKPVTQYRPADRRTCAGSCHSEPSWKRRPKNFQWYLKLLVDAGAHIAAAVAPLTKNARLVCAARGAILECLGAPSPRSRHRWQVRHYSSGLRNIQIRRDLRVRHRHDGRFRKFYVFHGSARRLVLRRKPRLRLGGLITLLRNHDVVIVAQDAVLRMRGRCRYRRQNNRYGKQWSTHDPSIETPRHGVYSSAASSIGS